MFTNQHYGAIAEIIRAIGNTYRGNYVYKLLAQLFSDYFTINNPQFNRQKFLKACGINP